MKVVPKSDDAGAGLWLRDRTLLRKLFRELRPFRWWFAGALVTNLAASGAQLLRPIFMQRALDQAIAAADPAVFVRGTLLLVALVTVEQALSFADVYLSQLAGARAMAHLRTRLFGHLLRVSTRYFDQQPVGKIVSRVSNDVDAAQDFFTFGGLSALGDLVRVVVIVPLLFWLDWRLALIAFGVLPPIVLLLLVVRTRAREAFRAIRSTTADMTSTMDEQVAGVSLLQSFGQLAPMAKRFDRHNAAYRDANMRAIKFEATQDAAIELIAALSLSGIALALGWLGSITFGTMVAFQVYLFQLFEPLSALAQRFTLLQSALAGAERVLRFLDLDDLDAPPPAEPAPQAASAAPALSFEGVTFGYRPDHAVLTSFHLALRPGERVAIVGPTGSGKSTLIHLLLRFYEPSGGVIRAHGTASTDQPVSEWRQRFALVPQDPFLFPGTVAENVAGASPLDRQRVQAVLARMGVADLFLDRADGLDAQVLEGGSNLSAGERQLLAFARALYRDAPYLLLDEATANVDSATEARIQEALHTMLQGKTALVIAHRLSTIREADRIVVLTQGQLVEQGTHEELIAHNGVYAELHRKQQTDGQG